MKNVGIVGLAARATARDASKYAVRIKVRWVVFIVGVHPMSSISNLGVAGQIARCNAGRVAFPTLLIHGGGGVKWKNRVWRTPSQDWPPHKVFRFDPLLKGKAELASFGNPILGSTADVRRPCRPWGPEPVCSMFHPPGLQRFLRGSLIDASALEGCLRGNYSEKHSQVSEKPDSVETRLNRSLSSESCGGESVGAGEQRESVDTSPAAPRPSAYATAVRVIVFSSLLLTPCFWQPRIQAGDLSSHVYNAWLAQLIERGQAPGLTLARQSNNVLFDLMLSGLMRAFGAAAAQRVAVSVAVLVFCSTFAVPGT